MKLFRLPLLTIALIACFSFVNHSTSSKGRSTDVFVADYTNATAMNECTGETVTFSGSMLFVLNNVTSSGGFHSKVLAKPQDLSFVYNGETFRAIGMTMLTTAGSKDPYSIKFSGVNNMLFIGEKSGTKYKLNEGGSFTVSLTDGTISNYIYHRSLRCE